MRGDCYNVAAYLARLGCDVAFMSAIGQDDFSAEMHAAWVAERVGTDLVVTHADRIPGLYAIRVDDSGERTFTYWRTQSAARAFFECRGADVAMTSAATASLLYLSGITLSLYSEAERRRIAALASSVRANGGDVVLDSNYRQRGWPNRAEARREIEALGRIATIALPTLEDDVALFEDRDAESCAARWLSMGVREVAIKLGEKGSFVASGAARQLVACEARKAVDTTGAGDAFNAGYIAARVDGHEATVAAGVGNRLAAAVVGHRGAIIPRVVMPTRLLPSRA